MGISTSLDANGFWALSKLFHHRIGDFIIAPHGLDVIVVVERIDQLEQGLRGRFVGDFALQRRAPGELHALGLAEFGFERLGDFVQAVDAGPDVDSLRSEEHTSELQSLMRISYAVFCLKKTRKQQQQSTYLVLLIRQFIIK